MKTQNDRTHYFQLIKKQLSILALLSFFSSFSDSSVAQMSAQGAGITVRVTDSGGAIVPKATVTLYTRDNRVRIKTLTDETGKFHFEQLAADEYLIEAEAPSFARSATQVLRVERNASASLDILLPVAGINERVVVTAQGTAQPVDEVS